MIDIAELERLAALGDPDAPIPHDAIPFDEHVSADERAQLLPDWYMPRPMAGTPPLRGWRRAVAWLIVGAFLAVVASGLCSTYGVLEIA
ncbi:hypothetical protein [Actinospongicola halichondriae]|uniref:hypothetical protein n=1 Tax=Actinospongicola halichondriae TaxID=3236844 RepID=UPI003D54981D